MTQKNNMIALAAGLFFFAATGFLATASQAATGNALNCKADSRSKVIDCCKQIVAKKRPIWMIQTQSSCGSAAVCTTKSIKGTSVTHVTAPKKVRVCSIARQDKPDRPDTPDKPDRPDTPNNPDPQTPDRPDVK